jgi:hypothetical protein
MRTPRKKPWNFAACAVAGTIVILAYAAPACAGARKPTPEELEGWPLEVNGYVPIAPGEHPRLLLRKSDVPKLRQKAGTPEGQAVLKRLRVQLNGSDGESLPEKFAGKGPVSKDGSGPLADAPAGSVFTYGHPAGYGLLYLASGDKKYAELGKQAMEKSLEGYRDRDLRYSFRAPYGALRAGPSLGWTALGYDLCYEGWDEPFRKKVAEAISGYNEGRWCSLEELARGERQHPGSNHWGMQVGGAALALLAVMNDPGVDMAKIGPLLKVSETSMIINMTQGFGDGGFFAEGDGTGSMASHIAFLPALQAWRVTAGKDFYSPKTNAQWMAQKWFFLTALGGNPANLRASFPERGGYPHNIWSRADTSGGNYFGIGFGLASDAQKAAMLWFYDHSGLKAADEEGGFGLDAPSPYPHHSVLSLINWPLGMAERNPGEVFPHAFRDTHWKFYAWRNRWQDKDDVIISILTRTAKGNMSARGESTLTIQARGKTVKWGQIKDFTEEFAPRPDGSTVMVCGDGSSLAIDFSKRSGADAMLVQSCAVPGGTTVEAGGKAFSFLLLGGDTPPKPQAQGDKVVVGGQTVSYDGKKIVLGK